MGLYHGYDPVVTGGVGVNDVIASGTSTWSSAKIAEEIEKKADKSTTLEGYGITDAYTKDEIDAKMSSAYKPAGSVLFAGLPAPDKAHLGFVYDVIEEFTTTSDFTDGGGKNYPAGTNVAVVIKDASDPQSVVYGYDAQAGFVDLSGFAKTEDIQEDLEKAHEHENQTDVLDKLGVNNDGKLTLDGDLVSEAADIDDELSSTSEKPLKNKAIKVELDKKADKSTTLAGYGITDGLKQISFGLSNGASYAIFAASIGLGNNYANVEGDYLVLGAGGYGGTVTGAWLVHCSARSGNNPPTPTMTVVELSPPSFLDVTVTFGVYTDTVEERHYFGVFASGWRAKMAVYPLNEAGFESKMYSSGSAKPTGWTPATVKKTILSDKIGNGLTVAADGTVSVGTTVTRKRTAFVTKGGSVTIDIGAGFAGPVWLGGIISANGAIFRTLYLYDTGMYSSKLNADGGGDQSLISVSWDSSTGLLTITNNATSASNSFNCTVIY